jgi:ABC-type phosphate transport system permease subunit
VLASALEITFTLLVGGVTVLAGLFGLYVLLQLFRNPSRR